MLQDLSLLFEFSFDGRSFVANLICLPLSSLDLILGMDWLSANHAMINGSEKSIVLPLINHETYRIYLPILELC